MGPIAEKSSTKEAFTEDKLEGIPFEFNPIKFPKGSVLKIIKNDPFETQLQVIVAFEHREKDNAILYIDSESKVRLIYKSAIKSVSSIGYTAVFEGPYLFAMHNSA